MHILYLITIIFDIIYFILLGDKKLCLGNKEEFITLLCLRVLLSLSLFVIQYYPNNKNIALDSLRIRRTIIYWEIICNIISFSFISPINRLAYEVECNDLVYGIMIFILVVIIFIVITHLYILLIELRKKNIEIRDLENIEKFTLPRSFNDDVVKKLYTIEE